MLTPWPRFVPALAVQACESPVGVQGHNLPWPHPAFMGSDKFCPKSSVAGVAEQPPSLEPGQSAPCSLVGVSGAAGTPGCGAVQAQGNKGGRAPPRPCREAAPGQVGMCLGCWGQFQNQGKGQ